MKAKINKILIGLLFAVSILIVSCSTTQETASSTSMIGKWKSTYDSFIITDSHFTYNDGGYGYEFEGDIANKPDFTKSSGYVTLKITSCGASSGYTTGYYTVVHWKNFNGTTCNESTAYGSTDTGNNNRADQTVAESIFTVENGYFESYGSYTKQ
jgi:hypothetical protein